ncbi:MAG: CbiX/SirB N-terminal domain-containing protein [Gemmatimonadaceae bacterium]|jgi:sirohydrochlorin ferrochelatase
MKAILLIDHGSRRREANDMVHCMANLVQNLAGPDVIVRPAHMELADPTIEQGFASCVEAGATEVIAFPYMLSPGRHSIEDIPAMVAAVATRHPGVSFHVTPAFGVHEKLAELILSRAGIERQIGKQTDLDCCWSPDKVEISCGDACRVQQTLPVGA